VDYAALFARAGYVLRLKNPEAGWVGQFQVQDARGGVSVNGLVPFGTPAYDAGLDLGDVILTIAGEPATAAKWTALRQKKPGESVALTIRRRDGKIADATLTIKADPALVIDDLATGGMLTPEQKAFRAAWLGTKIK
jgi:predicted metalloprotease with PDZ domain